MGSLSDLLDAPRIISVLLPIVAIAFGAIDLVLLPLVLLHFVLFSLMLLPSMVLPLLLCLYWHCIWCYSLGVILFGGIACFLLLFDLILYVSVKQERVFLG